MYPPTYSSLHWYTPNAQLLLVHACCMYHVSTPPLLHRPEGTLAATRNRICSCCLGMMPPASEPPAPTSHQPQALTCCTAAPMRCGLGLAMALSLLTWLSRTLTSANARTTRTTRGSAPCTRHTAHCHCTLTAPAPRASWSSCRPPRARPPAAPAR